MNDSSPPPAPDELPELPSEPAGAAPGNRQRRRALWGALAVIAVAVGAIAVRAADDDAPRLPLALGASGAGKEAAAPTADMSMRAFVHYTAGDDLPTLGERGPAYRLSDTADEAAVRRLAGAFGLEDALERDGDVWRATDGTHAMEVYPGFGAGWWFGPQDATKSSEPSVGISSGGGSDSGFACAPPPDANGGTADCRPVTTTSTISPDLPTEGEARAIALEVLDRAGIDTDGAKVTVDGPYEGWYVSVEPELDGLATGMVSSVTVGDDGEVIFASGVLAEATKVGDYETVDTRAAIGRLNEGYGGGFAGSGYAEDTGSVTTAVGMAEIAVEEGTSEPAIAEECVASSDGRESCSPVCPDAALAPTTIPAADASDDPTSTGAVPEPAIAPDGLCGVAPPMEPQEPIEVVLHDAEPILMLVGSTDGSDDGYLVPGYRFTGDEGIVVDQMAIADEALEPVDPSGDTPTEPAPDPATGSGSSSSPGAAGGGSPGYDPDGSVSSPVQPAPGTNAPSGPTTPCTLPEPGPNGEVPLIGCAEAPTP